MSNSFRGQTQYMQSPMGFGGGGYGDPLTRDTARVLHDVLEGWESRDKARAIYGVIFTGGIEDETLAVDALATEAERAQLMAARGS